jgi:hypothetical protein
VRTARNLDIMARDLDTLPITEGEEQARRRVWARVQLGMKADYRRRARQAFLAGMAGAFVTGAIALLILL